MENTSKLAFNEQTEFEEIINGLEFCKLMKYMKIQIKEA